MLPIATLAYFTNNYTSCSSKMSMVYYHHLVIKVIIYSLTLILLDFPFRALYNSDQKVTLFDIEASVFNVTRTLFDKITLIQK